MFNSLGTVLDPKKSKAKYPEARVIVLDDNFNTFQHVANCLITIIGGEQVGWSLVSEYKIGNKYIERIGELQKRITKISKDNWLAINGRAIKIDEISIEIPT